MKKLSALAFITLAGLLTACNPPWAQAAAGDDTSINELCLQEGFTPCRPHQPNDLAD